MKTYTLSNGNTYEYKGEYGERISDNMTFGEWKELYDMDAPVAPIAGSAEEYMEDDCDIIYSYEELGFIPVDEEDAYARKYEIDEELKYLKNKIYSLKEEIEKNEKEIEELKEELLYLWED